MKWCINKTLFILFSFISCYRVFSQENVIKNHSFEEFYRCDSIFYPGTIDYNNLPIDALIKDWDAILSTPDFFMKCDSIAADYSTIPQNIFGYQFAKNGSAYVGLGTYAPLNHINFREYIGQKIVGLDAVDYCFSMYVSKADNERYSTSRFCVLFSDSIIHWQSFKQYDSLGSSYKLYPFRYKPQLIINSTITDDKNWVKISGKYNATGNEKYIVIGNMFDDNECGATYSSPLPFEDGNWLNCAYYYIDDISLKPLIPANAGRDTTICKGDSVQIGMPYWEGLEYEWQAVSGLQNLTKANPWVKPFETTTYNLTLHQCQDTHDAVTITVQDCNVAPIINLPSILKQKEVLYIKNLPSSNTISIFSTAGQLVQQFINYQNTETLGTIAEGLYLLKVTTTNGYSKVGKLVVVD